MDSVHHGGHGGRFGHQSHHHGTDGAGRGRRVGHHAKAALGAARAAGLELPDGMMGKVASTLARGGTVQVDTISVMINVYAAGVSVSYGGSAAETEAGAGEDGVVEDGMGGQPPVDAAPPAQPESGDEALPEATAAAVDVAPMTADDTEEDTASAAAQGYSLSAWAVSASVQVTSASIALSLLR